MTTRAIASVFSTRRRTIAYWALTLLLATECIVGGIMGALRLPPFIGIIEHLRYPPYFMTILGVFYMLAGFALLAPGVARLKDWAYAGLIFNYTGAAASHWAVHDGFITLIAPTLFACLTAASWAFRPSDRHQFYSRSPVVTAFSPSRTVSIVYWVATVLVAAELALGGIWDLLRISYVQRIIEQLGYPSYLLTIIGIWKVPAAVVLLLPHFSTRLKEWAYAGATFIYTGAIASHLTVGNGTSELIALTVFVLLTATSWALRQPPVLAQEAHGTRSTANRSG
jgi:uncharacterized membrane protein